MVSKEMLIERKEMPYIFLREEILSNLVKAMPTMKEILKDGSIPADGEMLSDFWSRRQDEVRETSYGELYFSYLEAVHSMKNLENSSEYCYKLLNNILKAKKPEDDKIVSRANKAVRDAIYMMDKYKSKGMW